MSSAVSPENRAHTHNLWFLSILSWACTAGLAYIASQLPTFDSSSRTLLDSSGSWWTYRLAEPLLRWDSFHFSHIAQHGYVYEYEWAFLPGTPLVMRACANLLRLLRVGSSSGSDTVNLEQVLLGGSLAACLSGSVTTMYRLTLHHMRSPTLAFLAALLSLLPSSPATLRLAGYTEPFFTYLTYKGELPSQWFFAALFFALAGSFRSNGIMLSGFIIWGMLVEPFLSYQKITSRRILYTTILTALIFLPFVSHQYAAYRAFCKRDTVSAEWCFRVPPLIYSYVQAEYWNVGFLRYWTFQQLPNFLISAPVLLLLLSFSAYYMRHALIPRLLNLLHPKNSHTEDGSIAHPQAESPFLSPSLAPHAIHALLLTLLLLFAAHTQIILRLAASMPFTYWAAAWLIVEHPKWGKAWVAWSVIWGTISVVLWATFLPPA
ncbi:glycosyltransferase family 76 protein [Laetiporus sulphureus 93-53]|uniref:GPI mannosyltransferase 2 n=1 Tax=Laetiporus sulphureus 93-53 TaxID=1314785 RepID=A0A165DDJ0_9APHY|nr:glycosyltransferase family 76 protein [Laetiporus sulphureus 93-53]KZT04635.1 glycosyltransferase family 76 protein [Laetiporus sulphureus 93-53]